MTKDRKAQIATVLALLAVLGFFLARKTNWRMPEPTQPSQPQDTIYAMLDAARAGDSKAYLACYTGPMQTALRQTLAETTAAGFSKYLTDTNAAIKGVAVSDPVSVSDLAAKVRVEYVFQDRNEAQTMSLEKGANGWKISSVDSDERVKTLIPYGTPIK